MSRNNSEIPLKFKIKINNRGEKCPCLVLLHGYGSNEDDLFSLAEYFPKEYTVVSFRAPIELPFGGYAWSNINDNSINEYSILQEARNSIELVCKSIQLITSNYKINKDDITLIGFSQGCILSWAMAVNHNDLVRRIVALSGYIIPELINIPIEKISNLIAYNSHGRLDQVIPIEKARKSIGLIKQKNPNVTYREYEEGHGINQENLSDILEWIKTTSL